MIPLPRALSPLPSIASSQHMRPATMETKSPNAQNPPHQHFEHAAGEFQKDTRGWLGKRHKERNCFYGHGATVPDRYTIARR